MDFVDNFVKNHPPKTVNINNENKEYLVGGNGKSAFLIFPGSGQDALYCFDLIAAFETKYKVIAVNYDGFSSVYSFFEYVNRILKQEKIERIILYGLSIGGFLAQHYVRRYKERVDKLIISHAGSTKSKTIIRRVSIPGKILYFFVPIIPQVILNKVFKSISGRIQSGQKNIIGLYEKYSTKDNLQKRIDFAKRSSFSMIDKKYVNTVYCLATDMEKLEKNFETGDLNNWKGDILIIRTDNDPLAQDDGIFAQYYPEAEIFTFHNTGHLTPFIQFEKMLEVINNFLQNRT